MHAPSRLLDACDLGEAAGGTDGDSVGAPCCAEAQARPDFDDLGCRKAGRGRQALLFVRLREEPKQCVGLVFCQGCGDGDVEALQRMSGQSDGLRMWGGQHSCLAMHIAPM